uniref:Uncharacterized protein n=1 Tax=Acrobeloides nanus TaxID=290746 RepID=A0A914DD75_9BILA
MEGLIIFGRAQEFLNRDDKNLTKAKEIFSIAKIRLKEKSILKLQSYIHARIAVDNFKKQRKLANEKLESRLTPKSLDRYDAN